MAEIGIAASFISVIAVGTTVATTLYEAADVMVNAKPQMMALAKHVSQSTVLLKHLKDVLRTEMVNCSKDVRHNIQSVQHSSLRTFKEIDHAVKSKRSSHFASVRWLFRRTKAMELEARLSSQQSMLQVITQTLTVSKLGSMDSRAKKDSDQIQDLTAEIKLLKTFIMENHNNLADLRRAENVTAANTAYRQPEDGGTCPVDAKPSSSSDFPNLHDPPMSPSHSHSPTAFGFTDDVFHQYDQSDNFGRGKSDDLNEEDTDNAQRTDNTVGAEIQTISKPPVPPQTTNDTSHTRIHRESDLLLQMIPYRPNFLGPLRSDYLLTNGPIADSRTESATQEATKNIRLLLDKWTTAGSGPVSHALDQEAATDKHVDERTREHRAPHLQYEPGAWPPPRLVLESDDEDARYYNFAQQHYVPPNYPRNHIFPPPGTYPEPPQVYGPAPGLPPRFDYWRYSYLAGVLNARHLGRDILDALRSTRGGIHYTKNSPIREDHYVDEYPVFLSSILPLDLASRSDYEYASTEIGSDMIRKEALDLLGYTYTETPTGKLSISGDISFVELQAFVDMSSQAVHRQLSESSKSLIKERGLDAAVISRIRQLSQQAFEREARPVYGGHHRHYPRRDYSPSVSSTGSLDSDVAVAGGRGRRRSASYERSRPKRMPTLPSAQADTRKAETENKNPPEIRFTLPSAQPAEKKIETGGKAQPTKTTVEAPEDKSNRDLLAARLKLEQLRKKQLEADKSKDHTTATDLLFYAIPDQQQQIDILQRAQNESQARKKAQQPEVHSGSEDSHGDNISEDLDLYD